MALSPSSSSFTNPSGANQFLGDVAARHDDQPTLGPNANRVQAGCLDLINATSPLGSPNKVHPAGAQTS